MDQSKSNSFDCDTARAEYAGLLVTINDATDAASRDDFSLLGERRAAHDRQIDVGLEAARAGHYDCLHSEVGCVALSNAGGPRVQSRVT